MTPNPEQVDDFAGCNESLDKTSIPMPSDVLTLCVELETALDQLKVTQQKLDEEHLLCSAENNVKVALAQTRIARRNCIKLAKQLHQMCPETHAEVSARQTVLNAYLAQLDIDRMPARQDLRLAYRSADCSF